MPDPLFHRFSPFRAVLTSVLRLLTGPVTAVSLYGATQPTLPSQQGWV